MELTEEQRKAIEQQKEHCPFCQIVAGKIPAKKVYEDDRIVAVLDINPAQPGHLLVLPKEHYPILPLVPADVFAHLFARVREIARYLREAMVVPHTSVFIANGQAAGQQSSHFLVHVIPSEKVPGHFTLPRNPIDAQKHAEIARMLAHNLPLMLRNHSSRFPTAEESSDASQRLAQLIEQQPDFKRLLIENPSAVLAGLEENPSLKPLFEGVDVHALSQKLREIEQRRASQDGSSGAAPQPSPPELSPAAQRPPDPQPAGDGAHAEEKRADPAADVPRAIDLSDDALARFLSEKEKLRSLLLDDPEALAQAVAQQPRLARFFEGTTPAAVRDRLEARDHPSSLEEAARRYGGDR